VAVKGTRGAVLGNVSPSTGSGRECDTSETVRERVLVIGVATGVIAVVVVVMVVSVGEATGVGECIGEGIGTGDDS
jgi:hypothetical protein